MTVSQTSRKVAACGTRSGYNRHLRNSEQPCEACSDANNRDKATEARRAYARAYQRALGRLRDLYGDQFDRLLADERAREEYSAAFGDGAR
jgi:hypothetical protein